MIERLTGGVVQSTEISADARAAVRTTIEQGKWKMVRVGDRDDRAAVRPPTRLWNGAANPLQSFGECGDRECELCRARSGWESIRTEVLDFAVRGFDAHVGDAKDGSQSPLVYLSLGSGLLHFDWGLLDRLIEDHSAQFSEVWLLDLIYDPMFASTIEEYDLAMEAKSAFAGWFAKHGITVRAFSRAEELISYAQRSDKFADMLVQVDAAPADIVLTDPYVSFFENLLCDGAVFMQASRAEPGTVNGYATWKVQRWRKTAEQPQIEGGNGAMESLENFRKSEVEPEWVAFDPS